MVGGGAEHLIAGVNTASLLVCKTRVESLEGQGSRRLRQGKVGMLRTGNTSGMPPRTALLPSRTAPSLSHSFSPPARSFHEMTVAPYSMTSTLSPVGSTADTREFPCEMLTCAWGARPGVAASAEGLFGRSTMVVLMGG